METIVEITQRYDAWLGTQTNVVKKALQKKHSKMAQDPFSFLRATFYRWAQRLPTVCPEAWKTPEILCIGDLHLENYGIWRDTEGRLIWGINDFDEATPLPYLNDIVRLCTSLLFAKDAYPEKLNVDASELLNSILKGYRDALQAKGRPFLLERDNPELRAACLSATNATASFWEKMDELDKDTLEKSDVPDHALQAMHSLLPDKANVLSYHKRTSGLGSMGRPRFVVKAEWNHGLIFREAKRLLPSGAAFAAGKNEAPLRVEELLKGAVRCTDPYVKIEGHWSARRLAPDCTRLELSEIKDTSSQEEFCHAMGWEMANVHLASQEQALAVQEDIERRTLEEILDFANAMKADTETDFNTWKEYMKTNNDAKS